MPPPPTSRPWPENTAYDFYGDFAGLLVAAGLGYAENDEGPAVGTAGPEMSVVAGAGFEPAAFRL